MTSAEIEALRALYREPDKLMATSLAAQCPDLGDCVSAQVAELARDPSRDRCDLVLANLEGLKQHVRRLAAALEADG